MRPAFFICTWLDFFASIGSCDLLLENRTLALQGGAPRKFKPISKASAPCNSSVRVCLFH